MNYEQARMIGPDGPAPGKWNWTNANDSASPAPYTVEPCWWPDYERPPFDPVTMQFEGGWAPTGRERCDHDTREEAERHHYDHELSQVRIDALDLTTIRERRRCDMAGCENWQTHQARWPGAYVVDDLCEEHATPEAVALIHPFVPGIREIHS